MNYALEMQQDKQELEAKIREVDLLLAGLPDGRIQYSKSDSRDRWFYTLHGQRHALTKKDQPLTVLLALKSYRLRLRAQYQAEPDAANAYLQKYEQRPKRTVDALLARPAYREILQDHLVPLQAELDAWMHADYEQNPVNAEDRKIPTACGLLVRSKSEAVICDALYANHIPFRYDSRMDFGNVTRYPDFVIRHPKTGEFYIWEHLGKMDSPRYSTGTFQKLALYNKNGWLLTRNLILTAESDQNPLDFRYVANLIRFYFIQSDGGLPFIPYRF